MKEKNKIVQNINNITTVFRLSRKLLKGSRGHLYFLLAVITLFNAEVSLMMPFVLKCGFRAVEENDMQALLRTVAGGACVFAFNFAVMYLLNVYADAWTTRFALRAAENGFRELSRLPVASVQAAYNEDDLFNRIAAGTGNIIGFYFSAASFLGNGIAVIALMVMIHRFSNMLGITIFLSVAAQLLVVRLQFRNNARCTKQLQKEKAESIRRLRSLLEQSSFHGHHQTWGWMQESYGEARRQWFRTQERQQLTNASLDSFLTGIQGVFQAGLVYRFMTDQKVFRTYADDLASSFSAFRNLVDKAKNFGGNISSLPKSLVPIRKLAAVLTSRPPRIQGEQSGLLALEHLSVAIGDKEILRDACCRIPLGSKVAIIGENGSGKSTLLKAIAGLYQCRDGSVYDTGRRTAYIPADELLFQGHSVMENISYGGNCIPADSIKRLLRELLLSDSEALCGKEPSSVSGGEAKRINIARALLSGAEIILADEPASCLDREASWRVMEKLLSAKDRTVIYVTHDPEHARLADEALYLQDGEIRQVIQKAEYGTNVHFLTWSASPAGNETIAVAK